MSDAEWTDTDLALLQSMDAGDVPVEQMMRRLGRTAGDIQDHLQIVRARSGPVPFPGEHVHEEEPVKRGTDEEGDVTPPTGRPLDDKAAWSHVDEPATD